MLRRRNYAVITTADGNDGLERLCGSDFDVAIVDIVLPGIDGFAVCRGARDAGVGTPILILSARDGVQDRVRGLDAGADDYLVKPFHEDELAARLRTLSRRTQSPQRETLACGAFSIDFRARSVDAAGRNVPLGPTEFRLLELLARNRGMTLARDLILDRIWGTSFAGEANIVDVYISSLRRKFRESNVRLALRTIRGMGYRFDG